MHWPDGFSPRGAGCVEYCSRESTISIPAKITTSGIEKRKYFEPISALDIDRLVAASREDPAQFVGEFRDRLQRSVTLHLLSDVPLAAMCSGGVDSSLIAAYAKDQLPEIEGYVADVQWPSGEGNQAERVGRHLGVPIRRIVVDQARFLRLWPYTVWHSDNPSLNPSDTALLAVVQACRDDGIKVLLTGEGSDELALGNTSGGMIVLTAAHSSPNFHGNAPA